MIQRNYYLDRLIRNMWNGEIKVITGIHRCGKSVLLFELFDEYLRNHGTDATQIIKIELDQRRYYKYRNPITLCEYVEQLVLGQQDIGPFTREKRWRNVSNASRKARPA